MTREEFERWWMHHASRFTGLHSWMSKIPAATRGAVMDAWAAALAGTDYEAALQASGRMFAGEEDKPVGYDEHPAAIVRIAAKLRTAARQTMTPRTVDGQPTYRCLDCRDFGWVICWHPKTVKQARAGNLSPPLYTTAVACHCEAGESHLKGMSPRDPGAVVRYDSAKWCKLDWIYEGEVPVVPPAVDRMEQQQLLCDRLECRGPAATCANYEPAFEGGF